MENTITMVTQDGTTITVPAHEAMLGGAHAVTMVTADGTEGQVYSLILLSIIIHKKSCNAYIC